MFPLSRDMILQRIPELNLRLYSDNTVGLFVGQRQVLSSAHSLAVLDVFSKPLSLAEGLELLESRVQVRGAQDWMLLTSTITQLYEAGILRDAAASTLEIGGHLARFDSAPIHVAMLNDRVRTASYLAAIREVVQPGDIVLDIGTGTGILAAAAAQAGARHVYAVEAGSIGKAARAIFAANGLSDRVTLVEGWSTEIALPETADVLVSEILSHNVFGESVLETTLDARKRLLKPGARLIPRKVSIFALPVAIPDGWLSTQVFTPTNTRLWQGWYQVDFTPLVALMQKRPLELGAKPDEIGEWAVLSEPLALLTLDLASADLSPLEGTATAAAARSGHLNGVVLYFEAELSPSTRFTTHPTQKPRAAHWTNPVWIFPGSMLEIGARFTVTLRYKTNADGLSVSYPG